MRRLLPTLPLLLAACQAMAAAPPVHDADAREYARSQGVSLAEAKRRLALQQTNDAGTLQQVIADKEPTTFAGLWIEHQPAYRVVVAFTRDAEATLRRYTSDPLFVARTMPVSQADLHAAQERAFRQLQALGVAAEGGTDIRQGVVDISVLGDFAPVRAALIEGRLALPSYVRLSERAALPYPEPAPPPPGTANPVLGFPRLTHWGGAKMAALGSGVLTLHHGCIRLSNGADPGPLVIWSGESALDLGSEPGVVRIFDRSSGRSVRLGEAVVMGGGFVDTPPPPQSLHAPIPAACKGPYFFGNNPQSRASFEAGRR